MTSNPIRHPHRARGFSLIEIMVGLVIGMLAVVIIMQIFASSEASKRTTTGGDDAQINGTIALYGLERDIRASGYGLSTYNLLGCSLSYTPSGESAAVTLSAIAPTTINPATSLVPAGDASTDTLLVMYGNSNSPSEGDVMIAASTAGIYQVSVPAPPAFNAGDYVIAQVATRPSPCNLTRDKIASITGSSLAVSPGTAGMAINSIVYNLGPAPVVRAYAVRNGNLTVCDYMVYNCGSTSYTGTLNSAVWVPIASNIVSLRAQYGRDASTGATMLGAVSTYDQITPGSAADTSGLSVFCSWARALAVRVAVVARSAQYDKAMPTAAAPLWDGSTVNATSPTNPTAVTIDLTGNTSWQYYRYKPLQTTIPLRNSIWQGSQPSYQGGAGGC
ncbi:PilW family protein [Variovorax terrae]|uniref:PilW family protein n=1 Tax=Variovorax terrae TaxID=2923278 RepID=A0A9X2AR24_9BURK|nr:PilW family protein [Variovorax terrae]MCJ0765187.1 PilW family protein [Variovorax terrae]